MFCEIKLIAAGFWKRCRRGRRTLNGAVLAVAVAGGVNGAESEWTRPPPAFRRMIPLESIRQAAAATRLSLEGLAEPVARTGLQQGDGVTALVTLTEDEAVKQWIIALEVVEPNEKEKNRRDVSTRLFSTSGYEFRFGSGHAVLEVKIIGPLSDRDAGKKPAMAPDVKRRRIEVSADYLALGLERVPATSIRVHAAKAANPALPKGNLQISGQAFPVATAEANRKITEAVGIMEADERAMAGSVLALLEFFQITMKTPGLQDVLKSVLDLPWWSIVSSGGKTPGVNFEGLRGEREVNPRLWNLRRPVKVYASSYLLRLNGEPAVLFQLAMTQPRPPLLVSAGIVGLAAGRPDGKGPVLTLQVASSRAAPGAEAKAP